MAQGGDRGIAKPQKSTKGTDEFVSFELLCGNQLTAPAHDACGYRYKLRQLNGLWHVHVVPSPQGV